MKTEMEMKLNRVGALALRLALGAVMLAHALMKWRVFTLLGTASFFASHGFPGWTAYPVFALELVGGILLMLGLGTRVVSAALVPVMLGALLVHLPNGWVFNAPNGGWEYVAFLIVALFVQMTLGDGAFAASRLLRKKKFAEACAHKAESAALCCGAQSG